MPSIAASRCFFILNVTFNLFSPHFGLVLLFYGRFETFKSDKKVHVW